ncbi:hypothetical protein [Enterococcus sp. DIV0800]|uniref:hypothetical protein n=1 Tax=unclassified Enterococcus TaxID=2608891 RepID=UPI003D2FCF5D
MIKKTIYFFITALLVITVAGCSSNEQKDTIDSLKKENNSLKDEKKDVRKVAVGDTVDLSGTVIIGEDLEAGSYDIDLPGEQDAAFSLYEDKKAKKEDEYTHEWLSPSSEDQDEADSLSNYKLRNGNILDIDGTLSFTKSE